MFATFPQSLAFYFKCVCCIFGNCFATYLANVCDMVAVFNTNSTMTPLVWSTNRILSNAPVAMGNIRSAVLQFWINVQYVVQHPVKHDVKLFCKMFTKSSLSACHSRQQSKFEVNCPKKHIFEEENSISRNVLSKKTTRCQSVLGKLGPGRLGPGKLGPSPIWRQIGPRKIC